MTRSLRTVVLLLSFLILSNVCFAQVYITTGQTGANGKLPGSWTVTPGSGTPSSFTFGGGYFLMGVTTGFDYTLNVRATNSSGALLATLNLTAAQLCSQPAGCATGFTNHTFTLTPPITFSAGNSYYVELVGKNSTTLAPDTNDGLKNPTSFSWVNSTGSAVDLTTTTAPGAPTGVTASAGDSQATVYFTAPSDTGGSAITSYIARAEPFLCGLPVTATCSAPASSCVIPGLANGTMYDISVQAQNIIGPGTNVYATNNPVAPSASTGATSYTLTGPGGGYLNTASGNFTVVPDAAYSGTVTITPSGGGLSSPVVLTFSNSASAQTFTVTPTTTGPVTLTPTNSGGLTNPAAVTYETPPSAPTIGTVTPGNASLQVAFTPSASTGGSAITSYTATCSPGNITGTSTASPISVTGLTNGASYSCSVTATNSIGTSAASSASSPAIPVAPATGFSLTGPTGGGINSASGSFTVTPNSAYSGTITITPSGGGLSTPITLTFSGTSSGQTFSITPTGAGPVTLTPTNSGGLSNPLTLTYATPSSAPTIGAATAGNGSATVAFSAPVSDGGSAITSYTATCNPGNITGSGAVSPIQVSGLTNGTAYTCSVKATNGVGVSASSGSSNSATPFVPATGYTLTGPAGGPMLTPSGLFTVTPNGVYNGSITIAQSGGGLLLPITLTFNQSSAAQTFSITPSDSGPISLSPTNNGSLTNASALTYATNPSAPVIGTSTAGNASISVGFTAPANSGGSAITGYTATCAPGNVTGTGLVSPIVVSGLTNGTSYSCSVSSTNTYGMSAPSSSSNSATPVAPATSFTFTGPASGTLNTASGIFTVTPNSAYTGGITITPSGGGLTSPISLTFNNSPVAQTFTVTPISVGPVTLTPTNNGSLTNPPALSFSTPPSAPSILTATPGNGSVTVPFLPPSTTGGNPISGYTATCNPGNVTGIGVASPLVVTGLTNGTAYTCSVTATNSAGMSVASSPSNSVTPFAPATSFSFSGPASGSLNTASASFTVTPSSIYTGTITITPSGGGLSTPVVLNFNTSSAAQTFTISPTMFGPITLTPTNSGTLTNPAPLSYATPSSAPIIGTVVPGSGSAQVSFAPPITSGGAAITGYTATCNPGGVTATSLTSPVNVTGLTNGTLYTCRVVANNAAGASAASNASNPVIPLAAATSFSFSGPSGGAINGASSSFSVTPGSLYTGTITITPSGGGLSAPVVLTFNNSSAAQTFTITPTDFGPVALTPTNSGSLSNPPSLSYATPSSAPLIGTATAGNGSVSIAFTPPSNSGGSPVSSYTAACSPGNVTATATASPIAVNGLTNGTAYRCSVTASNAAGTSASSGASNSVTPTASASGYTLTGPAGGALNGPSGVFTIRPNAVYTGSITITPSGGGLSLPVTLNFSNSSSPQTFTIAPTAVGPVTLTPTNSNSLMNPPALTYATPSLAPKIGTVVAGNASATIPFTNPVSDGGAPISSYTAVCSPGNFTASGAASPLVVSGLTNGTAYTCSVTATNSAGTSVPSGDSNSVTPFSTATSFTLTGPASGQINAPSASFAVTPGGRYTGTITITPSGGGLSTPVILTFSGSSAAQTFTLTPAAIGPVTLSPANNGSLTNPPALTYATPSSAPLIGTATAGNGSASVSFSPPASTGGAAISTYTATCNPGNLSNTGAASPIVVSGLTNGVAYSCSVTATNLAGLSAASAPSNSITLPNVPGIPEGVLAVPGNGQATISFRPPTSIGGSPISSYRVVASPGGLAVTGAASPLTIKGLSNGAKYTFSVTATNQAGTGLPAVSNSVVPTSPPDAPWGVSAVAGSGQATISFSAPVDNGSPILGYTVVSSPGGLSAAGAGSPVTITGLTNGTAYTFSVSAVNSVGAGPASSASNSITPQTGSGRPAGLQITSLTFPLGVVGSGYPLQLLTATGGVAPYTFSISDGALPPGLTFTAPQFGGMPSKAGDFTFTMKVTDATGNTAISPSSIHINAANADLILSESAVSFTLMQGAQSVPMPASVTVRSSVIQQLLDYAVTMSPPAPWLDVLGGGKTPGSIRIALSPAALNLSASANAYQTTITATCASQSSCAGSSKTIVVSLNIAALPAKISLTQNLLSFDALTTRPGQTVQLAGLQNTGSGTISIQSATAANAWISLSNVPASLSPGQILSLTVTVDSSGLTAGFYSSSIALSTSAGPITIPVNLRVAPKSATSLAPSGAQFRTTAGGPVGNSNGTFLVSVPSGAEIHWQAAVVAGADWLSLKTSEGSASADSPGSVKYAVDPSRVDANVAHTYYGLIRVTSDDVANSPIDFQVVLDVMPSASQVKPEPSPSGLVFTANSAVIPPAQSVVVYASSTAALPYQASTSTHDGGSWLSASPSTGIASSSAPGQSSVSVNITGLAPGVYRGGVSYAFSSAAVRTVNVTLIVGAGQQTTCTPSKLIATEVGMPHNFQQPSGLPVEVAMKLVTDCGTAVPDAQASASFSNGDPTLILKTVDRSSGIYSGTWTPRAVSSQVTVTLSAAAQNYLTASTQITGQVTAATTPILASNAALHIFRPTIGGTLAPGAAIQIYGTNLAAGEVVAQGNPLPTRLAGTSVSIGGLAAPLYYVSPTQINAQAPFELIPGKQYEVQVNVNGNLSTSEPISIVPAAPGIAASPNGGAIAQHADYTLVSDASPAKPGEYIILYLAGMGSTDATVATGAAAPSAPLVHPSDMPVLTINGSSVEVKFAGLTPYLVGLYQINFQVPADLPDGRAEISVSQSGAGSNHVTLPVAH